MHTVLTDNGTHFTTPGDVAAVASIIEEAIAAGENFRAHSFESACAQNDIDHRLSKPRHAWTNGQVERMNRTIEDATVERYHSDSHEQLRAHLADFVMIRPHGVVHRQIWWIMLRGGSVGAGGRAWRGRTWCA